MMLKFIRRTFDDQAHGLSSRLVGLYALLIVANVGVWAWALYTFRHQPVMLGSALTGRLPSCISFDTTDGVLMLGAYNWAFVNPMRKLYYNLIITAVSVVVAETVLTLGGEQSR